MCLVAFVVDAIIREHLICVPKKYHLSYNPLALVIDPTAPASLYNFISEQIFAVAKSQ